MNQFKLNNRKYYTQKLNHLVDCADRPLSVLKEAIQTVLALLLLLTQHLATGFLNDRADRVDILDEPIHADAALAGGKVSSVVRGLLDATREAQAGVEVEQSDLLPGVLFGCVLE